MNPPSNPCSGCGNTIPVDAPVGVCPRCALVDAADISASGPVRHTQRPAIEELATAFPGLEFEGFLGAGGMGFVYRVRDRTTGQIGALKVLPRDLVADPAFVERFEREARTLARLEHPNIVRLKSWGQAGGFCHLLMEHVEGANLREALRAGRFSPGQALALVGPCAMSSNTPIPRVSRIATSSRRTSSSTPTVGRRSRTSASPRSLPLRVRPRKYRR